MKEELLREGREGMQVGRAGSEGGGEGGIIKGGQGGGCR